MNILLKVLIFISLLSLVFTDKCHDSASNPGDCSFYTECLEAQFQCRSDGYPVGYGNRYCSKFLEFYDKFAPSGKQWIDKTLVCLKGALIPSYDDKSTTCEALYSTAFNSHPDCYVKSGFCDIFLEDFTTNISGLLNVYEIRDFGNLISIKQVLTTAERCGAAYVRKMMEAIKRILIGRRRFLEKN